MRCAMPLRTLRLCRRDARYVYLRAERVLVGYCAQHDRAPGSMILRPYAWEYDCKHDRATGAASCGDRSDAHVALIPGGAR